MVIPKRFARRARTEKRARDLLVLLLLTLVYPSALAAQTIPRVTATFKTPENKTPSAAGLRVVATISSIAAYGTVDFVPVDSSGNQITRILCGGVTYQPQRVRAWIKSDGTLFDRAGAAGVDLVPTAGCTPAGATMRATISFPASTNGRRPEVIWTERKSVTQVANVDWSAL